LGLQAVEVPSSPDSGVDMDALEAVLERWQVRAVIVSPAFSTPSGALMPLANKQRLLALADRHDLVVVEDDIYADTGLGEAPDPLKALDAEDRVILCGSFSKSLSRDLRLGWISGGRWHSRILHLKLITQLASSRYLQQGVAEFMAEGHYAAHVRRQRQQLRANRDQLLAALNSWPVDVRTSVPQGGLSVWVELPQHVDTLAAYPKGLQAGVVITPGPLFSVSGQFGHCLRLSFAHPWTEERAHALARLPELLL